MNKAGRKLLEAIHKKLEDLKAEVAAIREEEEEKKENLPDNLQESALAEDMDSNINDLDEAESAIEEAVNFINDVIQR